MSYVNLCIFAIFIFAGFPITDAYDIVVYGATPGGIAAAITAARVSSSISIVIIEPTRYIGGMVAAGGIGLRDLGLEITSKEFIRLYFSIKIILTIFLFY